MVIHHCALAYFIDSTVRCCVFHLTWESLGVWMLRSSLEFTTGFVPLEIPVKIYIGSFPVVQSSFAMLQCILCIVLHWGLHFDLFR